MGDFLQRWSVRSLMPVLVLSVSIWPLFMLSGCAGKRIRAAYETQHATPAEVTRERRPAVEANQAPYHVIVRIGSGIFDKVMIAALPKELIDDVKLAAIRQEGAAQLNELRRRGPIARRIAERVTAMRDSGQGELTPSLHVREVHTRFTDACEACLGVELVLDGGLEGGMHPMTFGGQVDLLARISAVALKNGPALRIKLEDVQSLQLDFPHSLPGPLAQAKTVLEGQLRERFSSRISENQEAMQVTVPLGSQVKLMPGLEMEGLGIHVLPGPDGVLSIGLNTNLNVPPTLTFDTPNDGSTRWDWAIEIEDQVMDGLALSVLQSPKVPKRFTRKGKPDPEGPVAFDLEAVRFTNEGFALDARFWYLKFPAWWRQYTLMGELEMEDGRLAPRVTDMVKGESDGPAWISSLFRKRLKPERMVARMGHVLPTTMPLRMAEGYKARMTPATVGTQEGRLILYGQFDVEEVAPTASEAPAGEEGQAQ